MMLNFKILAILGVSLAVAHKSPRGRPLRSKFRAGFLDSIREDQDEEKVPWKHSEKPPRCVITGGSIRQDQEEAKTPDDDASLRLHNARELRNFAEKRRNCVRQPAMDSISENEEEQQGSEFFEQRQQSTGDRARKTLEEFIDSMNERKDNYLQEQKRQQDAKMNAISLKYNPDECLIYCEGELVGPTDRTEAKRRGYSPLTYVAVPTNRATLKNALPDGLRAGEDLTICSFPKNDVQYVLVEKSRKDPDRILAPWEQDRSMWRVKKSDLEPVKEYILTEECNQEAALEQAEEKLESWRNENHEDEDSEDEIDSIKPSVRPEQPNVVKERFRKIGKGIKKRLKKFRKWLNTA